ncbi:MAG: inositol monophosphatase [Deltaproteobacteria bacterium]|nr:inositol monophosphatase [Deltaproteobacteria bacterium]
MVDFKGHEIEDLTQFAMEVIRRSGEKALSYYGKGKPQVKFDERLVTEAELHLMEFFQDQLHTHFPEHQVFKNNPDNKGYTHEGKRYLWIYDAFDGVANFQAGIPIWGISLALIENFWPIFGVFYMPVTGDLFHAQAGHKAFWGKKEIRVSAQENINDESLLFTYSRFHHNYHSTFPGKIRDLGCTVAHLCYVAMGRAEAAVIANESYQDLAAARVIIEAAGGKIYKMDGSEFFLNEYLEGQRIEDPLLIAAPDIYPQVRNCLQEIY